MNKTSTIQKPARKLTTLQKGLAKNAINDPRYSVACKAALRAYSGAQFETDAEGFKVKIWSDDIRGDAGTDEDVRTWLRGLRVLDDSAMREGLEFVRPSYIETMKKNGMLRFDAGFWWITAKCAERYKLARVNGKAFPV